MTTTKTWKLDLALQGGGSHGAYTWGVLDALLEDGRIYFDGVSGTSAGAMNAAMLAAGFAEAQTEGMSKSDAHLARCASARQKLHDFWADIGQLGTMLAASPASFASQMMPWLQPILSPAQSNPFDINPLRTILQRHANFEQICQLQTEVWMPTLFICATSVRTGQSKIFSKNEISAATIMASACLPLMYQAVEIDGEQYWDGGYTGNPPLYPLIYDTAANDILLVQINPIEIEEMPTNLSDIQERINQINFNAGLISELRAIRFVARLMDEQKLSEEHYRKILMHQIDGGAKLMKYGAASKVKSDWPFLQELFQSGRRSGLKWIKESLPLVGKQNTMNMDWLG